MSTNGCDLSDSNVTLNLNLTFAGTGTLAITHVGASTTFNTIATVTSSTPTDITVSSTGPSTPAGFSSSNTVSFGQTGPAPSTITFAGSQSITGPGGCSTPTYLINGANTA